MDTAYGNSYKGQTIRQQTGSWWASFQTSEGEHQHAFLFPNIEDSTFHQPQAGPPFSPERETCCMLSFCVTFRFLLLYRHNKTRLSIFPESLVFLSLCRCAKPICNPLTCLLIKRQSALLTYFLRALFRILPVEFFGISSISMKCLGILYAAILPFMNFRISFSSSV